ncbi:hypothetical protein [Nocardia sp. NBC_01327]|uniref:hypothetical protein n=1 Tax=Nocardia sp. NBC_01327 TaxID=2903593 RepID=UPI002E11E0C7|nr:hypothetical protein OG326_06650 [Nocardia sp. NBC_01327]
MREDYPTDDELRQNFDAVLAEVLDGQGLRTATGLDSLTEDALLAIDKVHPNVSPELIAAARASFAGQMDGSHAALWEEELARRLAED